MQSKEKRPFARGRRRIARSAPPLALRSGQPTHPFYILLGWRSGKAPANLSQTAYFVRINLVKPRILLTCGSVTEKSSSPSGEVPDRPKTRTGLLAEYVRCVALAGGAPLLLPNTDDSEAVAASFEVADGLLLTGGWDIHPAEYLPGDEVEPAVGKCGGTDRRRDRTEWMACLAAMARGLPILGICRGSQMLNVAMGGSLIPHVPDRQALRAGASAVNHRADHAARFEPGSVIAGLWAGLDQIGRAHV